MGCDLCKVEPSIVATFHFQHSNDDASNLMVFSGALGMHTDTNDVILQTFFAVKSVSVLQSLLLAHLESAYSMIQRLWTVFAFL